MCPEATDTYCFRRLGISSGGLIELEENMRHRMLKIYCVLGILGLTSLTGSGSANLSQNEIFQDTFRIEDCDLSPRGVNDYFMPLFPGYSLLLKGEEDGDQHTVWIKVLPRTKMVDGTLCAVIREMEWVNDELDEISWNYFAICSSNKTVFYFGEDVDIYDSGNVVSHEGAWLAGDRNARAGLAMPGYPVIGSRYFQEIAPNAALDRAEHTSVTGTIFTPAGTFEECLLVTETTPLEPGTLSTKAYAPGIGLVQDDTLLLTAYGMHVFPDGIGSDGD
jgi:hypothetical protein